MEWKSNLTRTGDMEREAYGKILTVLRSALLRHNKSNFVT